MSLPRPEPIDDPDGESGDGLSDKPGSIQQPTAWLRRHRLTLGLSACLVAALAYGISVAYANSLWVEHSAGLESEIESLSADLADRTDERDTAADRADTAESQVARAQRRAEDVESAAEDRLAGLDEREIELDERASALDEREEELAGAERRQAETRITNGTWTVGVDIAPGTYRTTDAVSGTCYWGIFRSGTNKDDIIQNDIVSGGRPTVTLREGQDFESSRCGTWDQQ
ncbi:hypothetical protein LQF12_03925 [Ruania suaedae]|uniref:hypothetical protein n=1 Tax=Ruania suaedae TaxID=2897774 RepID=UPI001E4EFD8C|nr:hypothetical protein [Ruania suaedae]UFU03768.1 hypothetical protein LQF12_03925 [Ruania suaedae]